MEITSTSNMASSLASSPVNQEVGVAVLKKSMDAQTQVAMQLISSVAQPDSQATPSASLPDNLGQNVNVVV